MNTYIIMDRKTEERFFYTETKDLNLRHWMINHLDMSNEYDIYKFQDPKEMKALKMLKRFSEGRDEIYKKVLCYEFLVDINYHKEAEKILSWIFERSYNYMSGLDLLSRKANYSTKAWENLEDTYKVERLQKGLDKLMMLEGNFRVATHPEEKFLHCSYGAFREFGAAQRDYNAINIIVGWCVEWEAQAIIDFALAPNDY